ncbi:unnamed protein product [Amaranthus hypochondriacus]
MVESQRERDYSSEVPLIEDEDVVESQVQDSSVDYKGSLAPRATTGSWKASYFIIAIEFGERLSYFGISSNMITYLTTVMHQDLKSAANSVNVWIGATTVMPLLCGFVADAFTGRYVMILFSAIVYLLGLGTFTMSQYIPSLKPCITTTTTSCKSISNIHKIVFYIAAYLVAIATGGYRPCLEAFGADQFDDNHPKERRQKLSFFNWWNVALCGGLFFGVTIIVYVQDSISWGIAFLILTIIMGITFLLFILGTPIYRYKTLVGSPFTQLFQVLVAAFVKRNLDCPLDSNLLYEDHDLNKLQGRCLGHTNRLRFLDKAAIIENHKTDEEEDTDKRLNPWRLASVTQVEELKLLITIIPIWLTCLAFGVGTAQGATFSVKQASAMNRKIFKDIEIPPASMTTITSISLMATITLYDKILVPYSRKITGKEQGINILTRIGIGMFIPIITMSISALIEMKRLNALSRGEILHVVWLAPYNIMVGIGDGFSLVGMQEFFYDQVPNSMRSLGLAFYLSAIGVGSFLSSVLIIIVDFIVGISGGENWIGEDVNYSHLDYYYWLLAAIFAFNLCVFMVLSKNYRYKNVKRSIAGVLDG